VPSVRIFRSGRTLPTVDGTGATLSPGLIDANATAQRVPGRPASGVTVRRHDRTRHDGACAPGGVRRTRGVHERLGHGESPFSRPSGNGAGRARHTVERRHPDTVQRRRGASVHDQRQSQGSDYLKIALNGVRAAARPGCVESGRADGHGARRCGTRAQDVRGRVRRNA
jgi:hypothetical protein